jgi:hypothetical protein
MNPSKLSGKILLWSAVLSLCAACNKSGPWNRGLVADYLSTGGIRDGRVAGATPAPDGWGHADAAYSFKGADNRITFASIPLHQVDNWSLTA